MMGKLPRMLNTLQPLALLVLRLALGAIMVAHGWPKLTDGVSGLAARVQSWGWPGWLAYGALAAEFFGGLLLMAGFLARLAALFILITMQVAMWKVHFSQGFMGAGGYEFTLMLSAAAFALILLGPGKISLDYLIFGDDSRRR